MNNHTNHTGKSTNTPFVFFGTPDFSVVVLEELKKNGLMPTLIVTAPDKQAGRGLSMTPSPVKEWAIANDIPTETPERLSDEALQKRLKDVGAPAFILAAYGKIIPQNILNMAPKGIVNVHPSLLPAYRGPSPIESQILANEAHIGVTLIRLDSKVDHGPIIATKEVEISRPMPDIYELEELLASHGGKLLAEHFLPYCAGEIEPREQDHERATHTQKFSKEDAELDLENDDPLTNYLKIQAFKRRPRAFFFAERNGKPMRMIPTSVDYSSKGGLIIHRVIPEGGREIDYKDIA